jgi:uncharacterized protein with HEPN domain
MDAIDIVQALKAELATLRSRFGVKSLGLFGSIARGRPAIPWAEIIGLRNRLIHGYDAVDLDIVWNIVERDLPALVRALAADPDLREAT